MTEDVRMVRCESATGCSNKVPENKEPFEDSGRRLCLPCTIVSCY